MGFQEQMAEIIKDMKMLEKRILASATDKQHIPTFTGIKNPRVLNYYKASEKSTDGLTVHQVRSVTQDKGTALIDLLCYLGSDPTLIFCNQRDTTEQISTFLANNGIPNAFFHGKMEQPDREKILVQFRNGSILFLVASDLAARGLDIPEVKNVIHYELPTQEKDFLHRNGRTARMHAEGAAWLLMAPGEALPAYLSKAPDVFEVPPQQNLPEPSPWITLYISGGKKDKLSRTDIVGFLSQKGGLQKDDIGKIEVLDFMSFVAVKKTLAGRLLEAVQSEKMKGKKYKIVVTR
jgi:superfamily II DNA/RNA helicase